MTTKKELGKKIVRLGNFQDNEYNYVGSGVKFNKSGYKRLVELLKTHPDTPDNLQNQEEKNLRNHLEDKYSR